MRLSGELDVSSDRGFPARPRFWVHPMTEDTDRAIERIQWSDRPFQTGDSVLLWEVVDEALRLLTGGLPLDISSLLNLRVLVDSAVLDRRIFLLGSERTPRRESPEFHDLISCLRSAGVIQRPKVFKPKDPGYRDVIEAVEQLNQDAVHLRLSEDRKATQFFLKVHLSDLKAEYFWVHDMINSHLVEEYKNSQTGIGIMLAEQAERSRGEMIQAWCSFLSRAVRHDRHQRTARIAAAPSATVWAPERISTGLAAHQSLSDMIGIPIHDHALATPLVLDAINTRATYTRAMYERLASELGIRTQTLETFFGLRELIVPPLLSIVLGRCHSRSDVVPAILGLREEFEDVRDLHSTLGYRLEQASTLAEKLEVSDTFERDWDSLLRKIGPGRSSIVHRAWDVIQHRGWSKLAVSGLEAVGASVRDRWSRRRVASFAKIWTEAVEAPALSASLRRVFGSELSDAELRLIAQVEPPNLAV